MEGEVASEITRSSNEDNPVSKSLNLTSDIFNNLTTLAEWETRGNNKKRTNLYGQSSPTKRLTHLRHSPSTDSSKQPRRAKRKAIKGQSTLTEE